MKLDVKFKTEVYTGAQNLFLAVAPASVLGVFTKCYYVNVISRHLQNIIIFQGGIKCGNQGTGFLDSEGSH